jgi:hypothetical protein
MKKNGKIIPYMDGEEVLFWWRVKRLKKMIRIEKWRKRIIEMQMWTNKLIELSKNIDKKREYHSTMDLEKAKKLGDA